MDSIWAPSPSRGLLRLMSGALCLLLAGCSDHSDGAANASGGDRAGALAPGLTLIAGSASSAGTGAAQFANPQPITIDTAGNLYVAETSNHRISKITPAGVVSAFAGKPGVAGSADGMGAAARFDSPYGIASDGANNIYVADTRNQTIRKITPAGVVSTVAGAARISGSADGAGTVARFFFPQGIESDAAGNLYVADTGNHTIRTITPAGVVATLAGAVRTTGNNDGTGSAARFFLPYSLTVDSGGNVYVADTANHAIRKITPAGVVATPAGQAGIPGSNDGLGTIARFHFPYGITIDKNGNLYVGDTINQVIRKIDTGGNVTTLAGLAGTFGNMDGTGPAARFRDPADIAVDSAGALYVVDTRNFVIRKVTTAGVVTTLPDNGTASGSLDGAGAAARFFDPSGVASDPAGNLYIADTGNQTIRKVTPDGVVSTLAGAAGTAGSSDGAGAAVQFNDPRRIAIDGAGTLYVSDAGNHTIRKISPGGMVSTLAGSAGNSGNADGTGALARFNTPYGLALGADGNLYVTDALNHTIRKITPAGIVTTLAGSAGSSGSADGSGTAARFNVPIGIGADSAGNLYVADSGNHTIRKITAAGAVMTLAGLAGARGAADGAGTAARFHGPWEIVIDTAGDLYVADAGNYTIRKITTAGMVTTVAGVAGAQGITLGSLPGQLSSLTGLNFIGPGTLAVLSENSVLRLVLP